MALNTASLFDQPDYADVIVSYSGRKTYCHKIILCTSSVYFKKLCGPGSHFAESNQDTIELKEDDPDAVWHLLRWIYTKNDNCNDRENDYALQLEISKVAQKYLFPPLYEIAANKFRKLMTAMIEPAAIFSAVTYVREVSDDHLVLQIAGDIQKRHILPLMKLSEYRDQLDQDNTELWERLDEFLDFKAGLREMMLVWCPTCGDGKVELPTEAPNTRCPNHGYSSHSHYQLSRMSCWVPTMDFTAMKNLQFNKLGGKVSC